MTDSEVNDWQPINGAATSPVFSPITSSGNKNDVDDWQPISAPSSLASQKTAKDPEESFSQGMGKDLSTDLGSEENTFGDFATGKISGPSMALQTMGNEAQPVWDVAGQMAKKIPGANFAKQAIAGTAQDIANDANSKPYGQWLGDKLLAAKEAVSGFADNHPELAGDVEAMGKILPVESAFGDATKFAKTVSENSLRTPTEMALPKPSFNPDAAHAAISDSYGLAKQNAGKYYDLLNQIGSGETANAEGLKPQLEAMIADIQNTPFHEATPELSYLKQQAAKLGDDGSMSLNDMVKLKQNLNSNFNPKRFASASDSPYSAVGNTVDNSLNEAAQRIPEFGDAKDLADKNWLNTVKSPFEDNKVLNRFWKPEDYYAKRSVDSGMLEEMPDATKQRAATMIGNIKNPIQLQSVTRALPSEIANDVNQAVVDNITNGVGADRAKAFAKGAGFAAIGRYPSALNNLGAALKTYSAEDRALLNVAKAPSPRLSTRYEKPYQDLKASMQQMRDSAGEMQPQQYGPTTPNQEMNAQMSREAINPPTPKLLPAPPMRIDASGAAEPPMRASYAPPRTGAIAETGAIGAGNPAPLPAETPAAPKLTPRQQRAAQAGQAMQNTPKAQAMQTLQNLAQGKPAAAPAMGLQDLAPPTLSDSLARESAQRQKEEEQMLMQMQGPKGYKSGGKIPTPAQAAAGNYKKDHIKFQGLDISIETPKGAIRRGRNWENISPADYGYFKRSVGGDGEHLDCYVGPNEKSQRVYIIDQHHLHNSKWDEHKVMLGFPTRDEAIKCYKAGFSDGKGNARIGKVSRMLMPQFKEWLKNGETHKPIKAA